MGEVHQLAAPRVAFGLKAAGRLMTEVFPTWVQDLALLVESVESVRPPGALPDWQPGAIVRLPFSKKICSDGAVVCSQALMALADTAMVMACSAAWNGYRPMSSIDQNTHFLRPVRRGGRRARGAHWPQHELRPRHVAQCRRPASRRHGRQRPFDAVKLPGPDNARAVPSLPSDS